MITLLNTSIVTGRGLNTWESGLGLDYVREFISPNSKRQPQVFDSAIGHQATAEILTELLGVPVAANRQQFAQQVGDCAIVLKVHGRLTEGLILSRAELDAMGYDFGMLALPVSQVCEANRHWWQPRLERGEDTWCLRATNEVRDEWRHFKRDRGCALWEWAEFGPGGSDYYHPTWTKESPSDPSDGGRLLQCDKCEAWWAPVWEMGEGTYSLCPSCWNTPR